MIDYRRFDADAETAKRLLKAFDARISSRIGKRTTLELAPSLDENTLQRMLELEREVFPIEDAYQRWEILEAVGEEESLFLLLRIEDRIEGYLFGYDDDIKNPIVEGADYFLDSMLIALAYEQKGIGRALIQLALLLLAILGYRHIGLTTEIRDQTGRELARFYRTLGFDEAETQWEGNFGMLIHLNEAVVEGFAKSLGIAMNNR